jgi:hypothetical protein
VNLRVEVGKHPQVITLKLKEMEEKIVLTFTLVA